MSASIFDTDIVVPGVYAEYNDALAKSALPGNHLKLLIIHQKLTGSGSVAVHVPTKIYSTAEAKEYFGAGSFLAAACEAALTANRKVDITAVAVADDAGGTAATGTLVFTGEPTADGSHVLYDGAHYVTAKVTSGDTPTEIALALKNACDAEPDLKVTASVNAGTLTLTAKNKGLCGNQIHLGYRMTGATGLACAVTQMASGATNPDLTDALAAVFPDEFQVVVLPFNNDTDIATVRTHINDVSGPEEQRSALGFYSTTGVVADATTLADSTNAERIQAPAIRYSDATLRQYTPSEVAAAVGALAAAFEHPAVSLDDEAVPGIPPADPVDWFSGTEIDTLIRAGVTPLVTGQDGIVRIVRDVTTRTKNASGNPDTIYRDSTDIRVPDYMRKAFLATFTGRKFPRVDRSLQTIEELALDTCRKAEKLDIINDVTNKTKPDIEAKWDPQDRKAVQLKVPIERGGTIHVIKIQIAIVG